MSDKDEVNNLMSCRKHLLQIRDELNRSKSKSSRRMSTRSSGSSVIEDSGEELGLRSCLGARAYHWREAWHRTPAVPWSYRGTRGSPGNPYPPGVTDRDNCLFCDFLSSCATVKCCEIRSVNHNMSDDAKKKDEKPEDTNPKVEASSILSILTFLSDLREQRRDVIVKLERLNVANYGPGSWMFNFRASRESRYQVVQPPNRAAAFVVRKPLYACDFKDIQSLHNEAQKAVEYIVNEAFVIYEESQIMSLNETVCDPVTLGLPLNQLCAAESPADMVCRNVAPYCRTLRVNNNPNYSEGYIAEGLELYDMRRHEAQISQEEMGPMRAMIIDFESHLNGGVPDAKPYKVLHNNDLVNVIANTFNLNTLFSHIPMSLHYSTEIVLEMLLSEVRVTPMTPSQLLMGSGQSMSKLTCLNTFVGINERPHMDNAIGYYVASLICPGNFNFLISLDDLPPDDIYIQCLAACAAKLLFSYSETPRWNSLCGASLRTVESVISRCRIAAGILSPERRVSRQNHPLDRVEVVPGTRFMGLDSLRTTPAGGGWRESGATRYGEAPRASPYVECQLRQIYATGIDDVVSVNEDDMNYEYTIWETRGALVSFLSALSKSRVKKTPMAGMESVFDMCAFRIFRFFIAMNSYNRENWYTVLRVSETRAAGMYDGITESPVVVEINGEDNLIHA